MSKGKDKHRQGPRHGSRPKGSPKQRFVQIDAATSMKRLSKAETADDPDDGADFGLTHLLHSTSRNAAF